MENQVKVQWGLLFSEVYPAAARAGVTEWSLMRTPCKFGCAYSYFIGVGKVSVPVQIRQGWIETRSGQDLVFCGRCGKWQYNAPRSETERAPRTVSSSASVRAQLKPKQRYRVIERAHGACELCHTTSTVLHVGHVLSVDDGLEQGLTADQINSPENLIAECNECNLGHGKESLPLWLTMALIRARTR